MRQDTFIICANEIGIIRIRYLHLTDSNFKC